jgi:CBS domain containing-hemolysin-like protein
LLAHVARAAAPVIWLLNASTRLLLRLLRRQQRFERALMPGTAGTARRPTTKC